MLSEGGSERSDAPEFLRLIQQAHQEAERIECPPEQPSPSLARALDEDLAFLRGALSGYEILGRIRYGGQGVVYRAVQTATKRPVAIKVLIDGPLATTHQLARFEREAELTSRLQHPGIVTLYEFGSVRGRPFLALQHIDGIPICDYVVLNDLTPRAVAALLVSVCRAVHFAHQHGVIHRDLSPSNILVDEAGAAHVLDFGLAKDLLATTGPMTRSVGHAMGTLPYASPEQAAGRLRDVDVRSDVYSLGVVLFELLTDSMPYAIRGDADQVRDAILTGEPMLLRRAAALGGRARVREAGSINHDLEMIVGKALAKARGDRYESAAAFADDLERYLAGDAVAAKRGSRWYRVRKAIRRHRTLAAVSGVMLTVVLASATAVSLALVQARAQRDNARQISRVANGALGGIVTEIEEAIRPLAGGIAVRDRILEKAAADLARLQPLVASDPELRPVLAALREKQGDVDFAEGRHQAAAAHYRAFLALSETLADEKPGDASAHLDRARAYRKLALAGDSPRENFERAIELGEDLAASDSTDAASMELCRARIAYSRQLYKAGEYANARETVSRAVQITDEAGSLDYILATWARLRADALMALGTATLQVGDRESGFACVRSALQIREGIAGAHPADALARYEVAYACFSVGDVLQDRGATDEAARMFERALELGEYLESVDPESAMWKHSHFLACDRLARLRLETGNVPEFDQYNARALRVARELVALDPDYLEWSRLLAFSIELSGQAHIKSRDWPSAKACFEEVTGIRSSICTRAPNNIQLQAELASSHDSLGQCYRMLGDAVGALEQYTEAAAIRSRISQAQPDVTKRALDMIASTMKFAVWHLDQNKSSHDVLARGYLAEAEEALKALNEQGRLTHWTATYDKWINNIRANQDLVARRESERDSPPDSHSSVVGAGRSAD